MKSWLIILALLCFVLHSNGQSISRQTIGSTGQISSEESKLTSTTGPSILTTVANPNITLTQGFQQPTDQSISVEILVLNADCSDINSGQIDLSITGCSGNYEIEWDTGDTTAVISDLLPGTYYFSVSSIECFYEDSVNVELISECALNVPNLITPNNDGVNDYLEIPHLYFFENQNNTLAIFNRWGHEVWRADDYDNSSIIWSGEDKNGNALVSGTYFYVLSRDGDELAGFIELLK